MNYHRNALIYTPTRTPNPLAKISSKMGYLKRYSKQAMPRSKPNVTCKKHPKHKQSPGVCSICLIEKLSQLSCPSSRASSSAANDDSFSSCSSSSSFSSYSLSSECSSCSSPMYRFRYNSNGKGSLSFFLSGKNVLTKSRSLIFVSKNTGGNKESSHDKDKEYGFLSKLLRPRNKKIQERKTGLQHGKVLPSK